MTVVRPILEHLVPGLVPWVASAPLALLQRSRRRDVPPDLIPALPKEWVIQEYVSELITHLIELSA